MAFTTKDRAELARARRIVEALETKEREEIDDMRNVLWKVGLRLCPDVTWNDVAQAADAIRDALEPFDSGIRAAAAPECEVPNAMLR